MQILPLLALGDSLFSQGGQTTSPAATSLFADLLGSYTANADGQSTTSQSTTSSASSSTITDPLAAAAAPSQSDIMNLKLTREDIASLSDQLQARGFSDSEISDMETQADSDAGLTWKDMVSAVKKKVAASESTEKKEISSDDQTQLLGLFGQLGFTADESQKLVDSLAKGQTQSVWNAVNAKVSGLSGDTTVSLTSSEIAALARNLNLSDSAQTRLTALFDQSNASQGLSGQGLQTAFTLVQNELSSQITKEEQSMADFREAASTVLSQAWQKSSSKEHSDIHEDDMARKAAQIVAMGAGVQRDDGQGDGLTHSATHSTLDVLGDVPETGHSPLSQTGTGTVSTETAAQDAANARHAASKAAEQKAETTEAPVVGQSEAEETLKTEQSRTNAVADKYGAAETTGQEKNTSQAKSHTGSDSGNGAFGGTTDNGNGKSGASSSQTDKAETGTDISGKGFDEAIVTTTGTASGSTAYTLASMDATRLDAGATVKTVNQNLAPSTARQVENALLQDMSQGSRQITLTLNPEELGNLSVTLTVKEKEIRAVIKADSPETAALLQDQAASIRKTLEGQGFKVTKLDVQTGVTQDNQSSLQGGTEQQQGQAKGQQDSLDRLWTSLRLAQGTGSSLAEADLTTSFVPGATTVQAKGLDLFA
jgi:flagellar hook-length control protein FliK